MSNLIVDGTVKAPFESLKALFEQETARSAETNVQLCVYHRGECVIDLWSSKTRDPNFGADSLVNAFSSSKNLEAIAMAWLYGQGLIDYSARVTEYWPAFGGNGKQDLTVADVMRHEGGMASLEISIDPADLLSDRIKQNAIGQQLESHGLHYSFPERGRREYHAITRGWIVNEIFRRVDPKGRTIGEFLREDITGPIGADVYLGLNDEELNRRSPLQPLDPRKHFLSSCRPKWMGRSVQHSAFQLIRNLWPMVKQMRGQSGRQLPVPMLGMTGIDSFNEDKIARGETCSANSHGSARGYARLAAMLAAGGIFDGRAYLSGDAWQALHDKQTTENMGMRTTFSQGGVASFGVVDAMTPVERGLNQGREGFIGWMGLGGSIFQWHPELEIGFAFVPTSLHILDLVNERGKVYQAEVLRCLGA